MLGLLGSLHQQVYPLTLINSCHLLLTPNLSAFIG